MKKIDELSRAQLKQDFKNMYVDIGLEGCYQVLYELLTSITVLFEVMEDKTGGKL